MAELTPEQIKLEQERLDLLQQQNEAVKNLTAAYNALGKIKGKLSDSDKEAINLAKILTGISGDIEKSINKRLSGSATAKDLAKSLNQLENDRIQLSRKSGDIDDRINKDKVAALSRIAVLRAAEQRAVTNRNALESQAMGLEAQKQVAIAAGDVNETKRLIKLIKDIYHQVKLKKK